MSRGTKKEKSKNKLLMLTWKTHPGSQVRNFKKKRGMKKEKKGNTGSKPSYSPLKARPSSPPFEIVGQAKGSVKKKGPLDLSLIHI